MTSPTNRTVSYGQTSIHYELLQSARKTLEIAVHPDKRIVVKAPASLAPDSIDSKVISRGRWINKQIAKFSRFDPRTPARQYLGGESHLYLGRKYRLKIIESSNNLVLLKHGFFHIESTSRSPAQIKKLLDAWYKGRAERVMAEIFEACWQQFSQSGNGKLHGSKDGNDNSVGSFPIGTKSGTDLGKGGSHISSRLHGSKDGNDNSVGNFPFGTKSGTDLGRGGSRDGRRPMARGKPFLTLRKMKTRWGSMSTSGRLTLNLELIKAPRECIEYVVYHELCHLHHQNHGPAYYQLLDRTLPDWKRRKEQLEQSMA